MELALLTFPSQGFTKGVQRYIKSLPPWNTKYLMSEQMIARWNAISMERPLKRKWPDDDDDDDDMSLLPRSPSPQNNQMDVDQVITVETKIKPANKGFALLTKLGWQEGQPVGLSADGRTEPVPFYVKSDFTGLGKMTQDYQMIETTVSQRRELDSERQRRETEEQRKVREDSVARKFALEAEISSTLKSFYCDLCDKQFKSVAQYDEHTNSYAHHHKARFKNMQATTRMNPEELDKRKEKERKREEKELRKIAAASGIKMPRAQTSALTQIPGTDLSNNIDVDAMRTELPEKSGTGSIISSSSPDVPPSSLPSGGFRKSGWTVVGPATISPPSSLPPPFPSRDLPSPNPPAPIPPLHDTSFRNAACTTLETGHTHDMLVSHPSPSTNSHAAPMKTGSGWSAKTFAPVTSTNMLQPPTPSASSPAPAVVPDVKPVRSNWQQFQKGRRK